MNKSTILYIFLLGLIISALAGISATDPESGTTKVLDVQVSIGAEMPSHYRSDYTEDQVRQGKELIHIGKTSAEGKGSTPYISKYYACTSCHNTVREHDDLSTEFPEDRLEYSIRNDVPFLPASTFYGLVNKRSWYNDDYILKYGELVTEAQNSLAASIQLCAEVCSQGRSLEDWEIESILAYFHELGYSMNDLNVSEEDLALLKSNREDAVKRKVLDGYYMNKNAATFGSLPVSKKEGYPYEGDAQRGKAIYQLGCQHCHRDKGESDVILDDSKVTLRWLKRNISSDSDLSIYQIIRKGTYSAKGHQEYMPHYTLEKMSDQQLEDLRAYIEEGSK